MSVVFGLLSRRAAPIPTNATAPTPPRINGRLRFEPEDPELELALPEDGASEVEEGGALVAEGGALMPEGGGIEDAAAGAEEDEGPL